MANEMIPTTKDKQTFRSSLERIMADAAGVMPRHMTPERMMKLVYAAATKTPKLFQCTPASIGVCLTTCSELGLEPGDSRGHVYLLPRLNRKADIMECTLQIGYKGYCELARRSGEISCLDATVVYKGEPFSVKRGLDPDIQHEWRSDVDRSDAALVAAYAFARLKDGSTVFEVLTRQEIDARRSRSMSRDNGPWVTDYARMARKSAIRALMSGGLVPMSAEMLRAYEMDNDDNVIDVEAEAETSSPKSAAASSLRALAEKAVQPPAAQEEEDIPEPAHPLDGFKADLARCTSLDDVQACVNAWLRSTEESLHGEVKALAKERARAFRQDG